jgi:hypothetical protein
LAASACRPSRASKGPPNIAMKLIGTPACTRLRRGNPTRQQLIATLGGPAMGSRWPRWRPQGGHPGACWRAAGQRVGTHAPCGRGFVEHPGRSRIVAKAKSQFGDARHRAMPSVRTPARSDSRRAREAGFAGRGSGVREDAGEARIEEGEVRGNRGGRGDGESRRAR